MGRIRRATRYIARYREIIGVLVRYGLADWAKRIDIDFAAEILASQADPALLALSHEERVRQALLELGPTFIKLGQILSVRPDLVGVGLAKELSKLQTEVTPDPPEVVERTVREELGAGVESIFDRFETTPVASASIGQVHRAWLKSGEKVAVKVRRHGIERLIAVDLEIVKDLARLMEEYVDDARYFRPVESTDRFGRMLQREIDFLREARNILTLGEDLAGDGRIKIPAVYEDLTTSRVLTLEWIDGITIDEAKKRGDIDLAALSKDGVEAFLKMILIDGFYHADPHPGNLLVVEEGRRLALLDFGMVGRLSERMRDHMEDIVVSIASQDSERLTRAITKAGTLPPDFDRTGLGHDLTDLVGYYGAMPVGKIDLAKAIGELMDIIHRHHIVLESEVVALMRTVMTLDGTGRKLSADFNLYSLIAPYRRELAAARFSPRRRLAKARRIYFDIADFFETVPSAVADIIGRFKDGTMEIHMEHRGLETSVNRLVFGIVAAAIFIGSSMLLSSATQPTIFGLSAMGLFGYFIATVMIARIFWSVMVSGRLD